MAAAAAAACARVASQRRAHADFVDVVVFYGSGATSVVVAV